MTSQLKTDLLQQGYDLRETHISWVFLDEARVYKIKKPVDLGFLDFTTLAARKRACQAELDLNRRLAAEVYLRLVAVYRDEHGTCRLALDANAMLDDDAIIDWAVEMVRLADADSAEARVERGALSAAEVRALAQALAEFHDRCRCDEETTRFGSPEMIERNVEENFEQTRTSALKHLSPDQLQEIKRFQLGALRQREQDFLTRMAAGRIRDGHGDLRLEHVYYSDGSLQIIDCIEFNDRFRYGDVAADIAFLSMDLCFHRRPELAELLLAYYAEASQDYDLYRLVDFYLSYRAYVRAKVTAMLEDDPEQSGEVRQRLEQQARRYFLLAEAAGRPPLQPPFLLVIFGHIAAGKSTLAAQLGETLTAPVLSSDRMRKHLSGVAATTSLGHAPYSGAYSQQQTQKVYARLVEAARVVLSASRPAIIDATCSVRTERDQFVELARACTVPVLFVECSVPDALCRKRLQARAQGPTVSDGRLALLDRFMEHYEPPDELGPDLLLRLDTSVIDAQLLAAVRDHPGLSAKQDRAPVGQSQLP